MMMMMGGAMGGAVAGSSRSRNRFREPSSSPPLKPARLPHSTKRSSTVAGPDSDSSGVEYPDLKPWLEALDANPNRNKHQETFSQYGALLVDTHKLYTIEDIAYLAGQDLATICGMNFGQATHALRFAKEDIQALDRKKRARHT